MEKYTLNEAIKLYLQECVDSYKDKSDLIIAIRKAYVRHRAGVNEDCEPCVGWWLEYSKHKRSCPAYCFHTIYDGEAQYEQDRLYGYLYINVPKWLEEQDKFQCQSEAKHD